LRCTSSFEHTGSMLLEMDGCLDVINNAEAALTPIPPRSDD
jgi:hypothetical protein